jgi:M6 family metalloprotease-like protein
MTWLARLPLLLLAALHILNMKNRFKNFFISSIVLLFVTACTLEFPSIVPPSIIDSSSESSIITSSEVVSSQDVSSTDLSTSSSQSSSSETTPIAQPFTAQNLTNVQEVVNFWSIPATGNPRVLVVPVEFPDYLFTNRTTVVTNINTAFNGNATSTFESQRSFYLKSSFNKLDLQGDVLPIFKTAFNSSYYENLPDGDGNTAIIDEIMTFHNATINFQDYDYNGDGNLDGIYMVYSRPVNSNSWGEFWWAYLWAYFGTSRYDGVRPTSYVWMPYNFVFANNRLDTRTFIHETGHMLGLEDYYDYDPDDGSGNENGLGGADIMDGNVGDHNPWSKMILGWIDTKVVTTDMSVELLPYISTGEALVITDQWNGTLFDEFIVAMYYTPTGLYRGHDDYYFDGQPGLVLYHVDARIGRTAKNNSAYPTVYVNNNTDTPHKLIQFIEADGNNSLEDTGWMWAEDVYRPGNIFNGNRNVGYMWNQSSRGSVGFSIEFVFEKPSYGGITLSIAYN